MATSLADKLKTYEEGIAAKIRAANATIDQLETTSKVKRGQVEIAAIDGLKATRERVERLLDDLKTTSEPRIAQAKAKIDTAIVGLEQSLEEFRKNYTADSGTR